MGANIIQFGHKVEMPISYPSGVVRREEVKGLLCRVVEDALMHGRTQLVLS